MSKVSSDQFKNYIKLSFIKVQLQKHINFPGVSPISPELEFSIDLFLTTSKNILIGKIENITMNQICKQNGSLFIQQLNRWDCIEIDHNQIYAKPQLKLQFAINSTSFRAKRIRQMTKNRMYNFLDFLITDSYFPVKINQIVLPLTQFIQQPYKIHSINLDFRIPRKKNEEKIIQSQPQANDKLKQNLLFGGSSFLPNLTKNQQKEEEKQSMQRDGRINFQFVFMNQIKPQLLVQKIELKSKQFSNMYKIFVYQLSTTCIKSQEKKRRYKKFQQPGSSQYEQIIHRKKRMKQVLQEIAKEKKQQQAQQDQETNRQIYRTGKSLEFEMNPFKWEQFHNNESFNRHFVVPFCFVNYLDMIVFALQYEQSEDMVKGSYKQKSIENHSKQSMNATASKKNLISTIENRITLDQLANKRDSPRSWKRQKINCKTENDEFQIEFEFKIVLNVMNHKDQLQQAVPQQLSVYSAEFEQKIQGQKKNEYKKNQKQEIFEMLAEGNIFQEF